MLIMQIGRREYADLHERFWFSRIFFYTSNITSIRVIVQMQTYYVSLLHTWRTLILMKQHLYLYD